MSPIVNVRLVVGYLPLNEKLNETDKLIKMECVVLYRNRMLSTKS